MTKYCKVLPLLCLFLSTHSFASDKKASELKVMGMYNLARLRTDSSTPHSDLGSIGGGLLLELALGAKAGFEFGGLYVPYGLSTTSASTSTTAELSYKMIHAPLVFRIHLGKLVSFGLGGFYGFALGKAHAKTTVLGSTVEADGDLNESAKTDYGALASFATRTAIGSHAGLIFEARYLHGLKNLSASSTATHFSHLQGMLGLGFEL